MRLLKTSRKHAGIWFQSTHSLRSATSNGKKISLAATFQSTHSLRSATREAQEKLLEAEVSIHALLAECDPGIYPCISGLLSFNPRTPCGVRPFSFDLYATFGRFQSTHSLRSATQGPVEPYFLIMVSIHALLAECDYIIRILYSMTWGFNPRTPCGVRPRQDSSPI